MTPGLSWLAIVVILGIAFLNDGENDLTYLMENDDEARGICAMTSGLLSALARSSSECEAVQ